MDLRPTSTLQKPRAKRTNGPCRGVRKRNDKWVSEKRTSKTNEKSHDSAVKAAKAYDAPMYCIHGAGELFNFPKNIRQQLADHPIGSLSADAAAALAVKPSSMLPLPSTITHLSLDKPLVQDQLDVAALEVNSEGVIPTYESKVEPQYVLEQVLSINGSQVEPYFPVFVAEETPIPYERLPFDETFIKDSDNWILHFMADPSNKD